MRFIHHPGSPKIDTWDRNPGLVNDAARELFEAGTLRVVGSSLFSGHSFEWRVIGSGFGAYAHRNQYNGWMVRNKDGQLLSQHQWEFRALNALCAHGVAP